MATTVSLGKVSTIEEFVDGGDSITMKYPVLSLNDMMGDETSGLIEFPTFNVYDDYIDELMDASITVELNTEEHRRYYQSPKLLAHDKYKNTELDFIIMRINGICDPKDFTMKTIKFIPLAVLNTILSKILISNKRLIETYNESNPMN